MLAQLPAPSAWVEQRPEPARKLGWAALAPIALVADLTLVGGFLGWLFFDYRGRAR